MPGLRLRLGFDERTILEVEAPAPGPMPSESVRSCTPCAFRSSVAHAHRRHAAGERLGFMDLPSGADPRIEIGVPPQGAALGAGLFRVPLEGRWLWGVATTMPVDRAHSLGGEVARSWGPTPEELALGVRWDEATEVTLAYAETDTRPALEDEPVVVDLLHSMIARWGAEQLIDSVAGGADRSAGQL